MQTKPFNRTQSVIEIVEQLGQRGSAGTLVLIKQLGTGGSYTLDINQNAGGVLVGENRLLQPDGFIPTMSGMYLMKVAGGATAPTEAAMATGQLHTFPNITVFTAAEGANMEALYRSLWQLNINNVDVLKNQDCGQYRRVGYAQQGLAASAVATVGIVQRSEWNGPNYGMYAFENDMAFSGLKNQQLTINLPAAIDLTDPAGPETTTNFVVFKFRGVFLYNGANKIDDTSARVFDRIRTASGGRR